LLGVWEKFEDIDFKQLPGQFVLKCTHDCGSVAICRDKSTFDADAARKKLTKALGRNYYWQGREWCYKNIRPRIIAEQYMVDESGYELKDYKIFNFDGKPRLIQVDYDRFVRHRRNLYTPDWKYVEAEIAYPTAPEILIEKPKPLNRMLELAAVLSEGIPHVRTDFYCINELIYFGELTFYHGSGLEEFTPPGFGVEMGGWINLPSSKIS